MVMRRTQPDSAIDCLAIGERLKAYRRGAGLLAEDVGRQIGVSRAAVYRMEQGEIVKIETLQRLATVLGTSMASLMGVEVEYYANAVSFLERMRQLEQHSKEVLSYFEPVSLLLTSEEYIVNLRRMMMESAPRSGQAAVHREEVEEIMRIVVERRAWFSRRKVDVMCLVGRRELGKFVKTGLVGKLGLDDAAQAERVEAARREVKWITHLMLKPPGHVRIGVVDDAMPASTFQIFLGDGSPMLAVSPFRFGELPNVRNGIATVTGSGEAVSLHRKMMDDLWRRAHKGRAGADRLKKLLATVT